jgi:hypothetical protein
LSITSIDNPNAGYHGANSFASLLFGSVQSKTPLAQIDNPGGGDCGAYAFALGLFDLAQSHRRRELIAKWKFLDPSITSYLDQLLPEGGEQVNLSEISRNRSTLYPFMMSLRRILCNDFTQTQPHPDKRLPSTYYIRAGFNSLIFDEFSHLCTWYYLIHIRGAHSIQEYVPTAMDSVYIYKYGYLSNRNLQNLVAKLVHLAIEKGIIPKEHFNYSPLEALALFDNRRWNQLIYGALLKERLLFENIYKSVFLRKGVWLTDNSLKKLAELFDVTLMVEGPGVKNYRFPTHPFMYLHNSRNVHWTTYLYNSSHRYPANQTTTQLYNEELNFRFKLPHRTAYDNNKVFLEDFSDEQQYLVNFEIKYRDLLNALQSQNQEQFLGLIQNEDFFRFFKSYVEEKQEDIRNSTPLTQVDLEIAKLRVRICLNSGRRVEFEQLLAQATERKLQLLQASEQPFVDEMIRELDMTIVPLPIESSPISDPSRFSSKPNPLPQATQYRFVGGMFGVFIGAGISLGCKAVISAIASALMITNPPVIIALMFLSALTGFLIGYYGFDQKPALALK